MSRVVYRLLSGKIGRKNADGIYETHKAPYDFVPSPGELSGNKFRLQAVGTAEDDSADVRAALQNTNLLDHPISNSISNTANRRSEISAAAAAIASKPGIVPLLEAIKAAVTVAQLDKFLEEECAGKPRKSIIAAIETRRDEILENIPITK